jgi:hypothetical protein
MCRLSAECLVRPVAADTDVGVDLYCETVDEGQPFLHFWVQVKTGEQCQPDPARETASCRFDGKHLAYWRRQPVPVYAALVPTEWPAMRDPCIYLVDLTTNILHRPDLGEQTSVALSSDYRLPPGDVEAVRYFLTQVVPATTASLQIANGVVADVPTTNQRYHRSRLVVPVLTHRQQIEYQLRRTAATSLLFTLTAYDKLCSDEVRFQHLLARIVQLFVDEGDSHWENFYSLGLLRHSVGDYDGAGTMYDRAKGSIEDDPKVRDEPPWMQILAQINHEARHARRREPFCFSRSGEC